MKLTREICLKNYHGKALILSNKGLTDKDLPVLNVFLREKANDIRSLYLDKNQLTEAPNVQGLEQLCILVLSGNQLRKAPNLRGLNNLWDLRIANNQLTEAPNLQGLINLQMLDFNHNQLTEAPNVQGLYNLAHLCLENNQLTEISSLQGLNRLIELRLSDNKLAETLAKNNSFYKKLYFMNVFHDSEGYVIQWWNLPISIEQVRNFESLEVTKRDVLEFICDYFSRVLCKELIEGIKIGDASLRTFSEGDFLDKVLKFIPNLDSFYNRREKFMSYLNGIIRNDFGLVEGQTVKEIAVEFLTENYTIHRVLNYKRNCLTVMYEGQQESKENYESKSLETKTKPLM